MENKRVALYARVSTAMQAEHGYSIEAQKETVKKECKQKGWKIVDEYIDAGISGKKITNRPEMQRMLEDIRKNKFDVIMALSLSRISRDSMDYQEISHIAKDNGVSIYCTDSPNCGDDIQKELMNNIKASLNQYEREKIVQNVKLGLRQRAQKGLHNGGRVLGYRAKTVALQDKKKLVIVESEAIIIKKIFSLFCEGKGLGYIANFLNQAGYRTVRDNTFSYCSIREILDNPIYKGYIRYGRYENWSEKRRKGKSKNPILVKGLHEPIVSEELWDKAALLRSKRSDNTARVYDSDNILSSILKCPLCGAPMVISRSRYKLKSGKKCVVRYYTCSRYKNKGKVACKPITVKADIAEKTVIEKISAFLSQKDIVKMVLAKAKKKLEEKSSGKRDELNGIKGRLEVILNKKAKILDLYLADVMDKELLDKRLEELTAEETELGKRRSTIEAEIGLPVIEPTMEYVEKVLNNFEDVMSKAAREQKMLLLRLLIKKITVKDKKVDKIYLNLGGQLKKHINEADVSDKAAEDDKENDEFQDFILEL